MQDTPSPGEPQWLVDDLADYSFLVGHDPPRPGAFLRQLKADLRSRLALRYWARAWGTLAVGLATLWLGFGVGWTWLAFAGVALALLGAYWLSLSLGMFLPAVRMFRRGPVLVGEIRSLRPHWAASNRSTAQAQLADGRCVPVSVPTTPAAELLDRDGHAEVLLVAAPDQQRGCVIGIRAVPRDRS